MDKDPKFKMVFRVPPLRNVTRTRPYFHDGSSRTLTSAIRTIAMHELGTQLSYSETLSILTFLDSFTGKIPKDYIKKP